MSQRYVSLIMLFQIQRSLSFEGSGEILENTKDQDCLWNNMQKTEVDNFEGVQQGSIVAVNLDGNYNPSHLTKVGEVTNSLTMQRLKGSYKGKWVLWPGWTSTQIPKESVIYFDIEVDENDKLRKESAQFLKRRY